MLKIRLPDEIESRLAALASQTGRTKTFYAEQAILKHLEDLEDYYLAAQITAEIRRAAAASYNSEDVKTALGLDD